MEGRAGMAAVVKDEENGPSNEPQFLEELAKLLTSQLPLYAIPVFIRLCSSVDRTGQRHFQSLIISQFFGYSLNQ